MELYIIDICVMHGIYIYIYIKYTDYYYYYHHHHHHLPYAGYLYLYS